MSSSKLAALKERYEKIKTRINEAAQGTSPTLIAVSKGQPLDKLEDLYHLGHRDFGENYVQELERKAILLKQKGCADIHWHLIGHLQTNKVKMAAPFLSSLHSLDTLKLAAEVAKRWNAAKRSHPLPVFIEVNIDNEPAKTGVPVSDVVRFSTELKQFPELKLEGLMCVPASEGDPRPKFQALRDLENQCQPHSLGKLSMGMSNDFEIALQEGATHIRVGTALFGSRSNP